MRAFVLLVAVVLLTGCRGLSREFNQALPEFLRADPGKEEMEIFGKVQQAREWSGEDLSRQRDLLGEARGLYEAGDHDAAADLLEDFLEQYPGSQFDEAARYLFADANFRADEYEKAFRSFKDFAALYPVSDRGPDAMETEYLMGMDFLAGKRSVFFGIFSNRSMGEKIMTHLVETYPGGARAADAQWALARYAMEDDDWPKAAAAFKFLADHYRQSEWFPPSLYLAAYCRYRQIKGASHDPVTMRDAREAFEVYLREAPEHAWRGEAAASAVEIEELEAEHLLGIGTWYIDQGKEYSARYYLINVMTRHPRTRAAATAKEILAGISPVDLPPPPEAAPDATPPAEPSK